MAKSPQLTDYVRLIIELFDRFRQERIPSAGAKLGRPFTLSATTQPHSVRDTEKSKQISLSPLSSLLTPHRPSYPQPNAAVTDH